jgi:hypothetical protein
MRFILGIGYRASMRRSKMFYGLLAAFALFGATPAASSGDVGTDQFCVWPKCPI